MTELQRIPDDREADVEDVNQRFESFDKAFERDGIAEHKKFAVHSLAREYRRMRLFMQHTPPAECFDAKNMLEVYDSWNRQGIVDAYEAEVRRGT